MKCACEEVFVPLFSFPFIWQMYKHLYMLFNSCEFSGEMLGWWGEVRLTKFRFEFFVGSSLVGASQWARNDCDVSSIL